MPEETEGSGFTEGPPQQLRQPFDRSGSPPERRGRNNMAHIRRPAVVTRHTTRFNNVTNSQ